MNSETPLLLEQLAKDGIAFAISPDVLWWAFGIIAGLFALASIILLYHWTHYGYRPIKTGFMGALYIVGGIVLLSIMFLGITSYLLSI